MELHISGSERYWHLITHILKLIFAILFSAIFPWYRPKAVQYVNNIVQAPNAIKRPTSTSFALMTPNNLWLLTSDPKYGLKPQSSIKPSQPKGQEIYLPPKTTDQSSCMV